ncbi:GlxA family transcriptional regulator [Zobellella aerophila]|uniref:GlxA family transcriptional regulator n=1 Tax=Zobellella aerophila TaxID=870480 RepID=A0ABP6WB61_9GAMM
MEVQGVEQIGFFLVPDFSMLSFAAAVEPLRMANRIKGRPLYRWHLYGRDDQPVLASNGMPFTPTRSFTDTEGITTMIVVAGIGADLVKDEGLNRWLRQLSRKQVTVGSASTGSLLLARAGILKNHSCTIHWENKESLQEEFPELRVTGELYEVDDKVISCSGGLAGLDMMLHLLALKHGERLANDVAEQCIHPNIRPAHESQRMAIQARLNINHPRLVRAIEVMRNHLEEVLSCHEVAERIGLSSRQLERLFKQQLGTTPASFYQDLRLEKAHHLLLQSSLSTLQVAMACGFASTSYFSRCYQQKYGLTPKNARQARRVKPVADPRSPQAEQG